MKIVNEFRYFIMVVEDFNMTWVYLLRNKNEVFMHIKRSLC